MLSVLKAHKLLHSPLTVYKLKKDIFKFAQSQEHQQLFQ